MCPACLTTVALAVAGATSTGGLTGLVVKALRAKPGAKSINPTTQAGGQHNGSAKSGVAS